MMHDSHENIERPEALNVWPEVRAETRPLSDSGAGIGLGHSSPPQWD